MRNNSKINKSNSEKNIKYETVWRQQGRMIQYSLHCEGLIKGLDLGGHNRGDSPGIKGWWYHYRCSSSSIRLVGLPNHTLTNL